MIGAPVVVEIPVALLRETNDARAPLRRELAQIAGRATRSLPLEKPMCCSVFNGNSNQQIFATAAGPPDTRICIRLRIILALR